MKNITLLALTASALMLTGCETTSRFFSNMPFLGDKTEASTLASKTAMPMRDKDDMKKTAEENEKKEVKRSQDDAIVEPVDEAPEAIEERRKMEEEKRKAREMEEERAMADDTVKVVREVESVAEDSKPMQAAYQTAAEEMDSWEK